jgi:hypothetical protein
MSTIAGPSLGNTFFNMSLIIRGIFGSGVFYAVCFGAVKQGPVEQANTEARNDCAGKASNNLTD